MAHVEFEQSPEESAFVLAKQERALPVRDIEASRPLVDDEMFKRAVTRAIRKCGDPTIDDGLTIVRGRE